MTTESAFINILRGFAKDPAARGLMDDVAVVEMGDSSLIITHDMMAEDVHFRSNADPADVAWKLVASNLSDLAAKGASPIGVLLGFMLGDDDWTVIDEYLDVAHAFFDKKDAKFVNGLLDAVAKDVRN